MAGAYRRPNFNALRPWEQSHPKMQRSLHDPVLPI